VAGLDLTVERGDPGPGARSDWIEVNETTFTALGGADDPTVHVVYVGTLADDDRDRLTDRGFQAHQAPAALPFYVSGAEQLVTSVAVTVASSAIVVALLASGFVNMELRAKRKTLATLKLYAGAGRVRRVIAGRGLVLLAGGHLLALTAMFGLTRLLASASPLDVTLKPTFALGAASATFVGGAIGLAGPLGRAGERVEASALSEREPPGWLPRWLRPSLASWRVVLPLVAAAMILAASLGIVFGMVDLPTQLFGEGGEQAIADASNNPLRGTVDPFPGFHLGDVDGFTGASPEIFAPSTLDGEPVMVRGVSWSDVTQMEELTLQKGRPLQGSGEAVLGSRLADRAGVSVGDRVQIPSAYTPSVTSLQVVGITQGGGLLDDEILVPLNTARGMTQLEEDRVNLVRYATASSEEASLPDGVEATNLTLSPSEPIPSEEVTVEVGIVNFGRGTDTKQLTLRVNGQPVDDAWPTLPGRSTGTAEMSFTVPRSGIDRVSVNPETRPEAGQPAYEIDTPNVATVDRPLEVIVRDRQGEPASEVEVSVGSVSNRTDEEGRTHLAGIQPGNRTVEAEGSAGRAAASVVFVEPGDLHRPRAVIQEIDGPRRVDPGQTWRGVVAFVNLGGEAFRGRPEVRVDNGTQTVQDIRLLSGREVRVPLEVDADRGAHIVGENGTAFRFHVANESSGDPPGSFEEEMSVEELLQLRREQARDGSGSGSSATQAFLGDTFENLNAALTLIVTATVLHAGLVTFVAVSRQIDERRSNLGALTAVGASDGDVRERAVREYITVGLPSALLGVSLGLLIAAFLSSVGLLFGFGHTLTPRAGLGFGLRIGLAALATTVIAALLAIEAQTGDRGQAGPSRADRPPLETLTGGHSE
jgi:hypothetical protein